jgi:hypothetical protein
LVDAAPEGLLVVSGDAASSTPQPEEEPTPASTAVISPTAAITPTATVTPTGTPTAGNATAAQGANLRSGPGTTFDVSGSVAAGQSLNLVATDVSRTWYQLSNGLWIAGFLVSGAPEDLPVGRTTATPVPTPALATALQRSNLRDGPSVEFAIVGSVGAGDGLDIVATDVSGTWYQLSTGSWIAGFLVDNPPADLPLSEGASAPAPNATTLGSQADTAYRQQMLGYVLALADAIAVLFSLGNDPLLNNAGWLSSVEAAVNSTRQAYVNMAALGPPASLRTFHADVVAAVADCRAAADAFQGGVQTVNLIQLSEAQNLIGSCASRLQVLEGTYPNLLQ